MAKEVEIKIKGTPDKVVDLYENEILDEKETYKHLNEFTKNDLIGALLGNSEIDTSQNEESVEEDDEDDDEEDEDL